MSRRDPAAKRLQKSIELEVCSKNLAHLLAGRPGLLGQIFREQEEQRLFDWNDPVKRAVAAHYVLRIAQPDASLKKAFEVFDLDPRNPFEWRKLIAYLAEVLFGSKARGAPKKWDGKRMLQFTADFMRIRRGHPGATIKKTCELMKKDASLKGRYKRIPVNSLRGQHKLALKWAKRLRSDYRSWASLPKKPLGN